MAQVAYATDCQFLPKAKGKEKSLTKSGFDAVGWVAGKGTFFFFWPYLQWKHLTLFYKQLILA